MEKLSLDSDSPIRGDYKRDMDINTPVRPMEREETRELGEVCDGAFLTKKETKILNWQGKKGVTASNTLKEYEQTQL